jgi:cytochrome c oxidase cbb3-type subunit I/II
LRKVGVPYGEGYEQLALQELQTQANLIAGNLQTAGIKAEPNKEIIAMIAYLQRLGTDIKPAAAPATTNPTMTAK